VSLRSRAARARTRGSHGAPADNAGKYNRFADVAPSPGATSISEAAVERYSLRAEDAADPVVVGVGPEGVLRAGALPSGALAVGVLASGVLAVGVLAVGVLVIGAAADIAPSAAAALPDGTGSTTGGGVDDGLVAGVGGVASDRMLGVVSDATPGVARDGAPGVDAGESTASAVLAPAAREVPEGAVAEGAVPEGAVPEGAVPEAVAVARRISLTAEDLDDADAIEGLDAVPESTRRPGIDGVTRRPPMRLSVETAPATCAPCPLIVDGAIASSVENALDNARCGAAPRRDGRFAMSRSGIAASDNAGVFVDRRMVCGVPLATAGFDGATLAPGVATAPPCASSSVPAERSTGRYATGNWATAPAPDRTPAAKRDTTPEAIADAALRLPRDTGAEPAAGPETEVSVGTGAEPRADAGACGGTDVGADEETDAEPPAADADADSVGDVVADSAVGLDSLGEADVVADPAVGLDSLGAADDEADVKTEDDSGGEVDDDAGDEVAGEDDMLVGVAGDALADPRGSFSDVTDRRTVSVRACWASASAVRRPTTRAAPPDGITAPGLVAGRTTSWPW
jgi:hypothetical protein